MHLPESIPVGARLVVRLYAGEDTVSQRMTYRDVLGHVRSWNGRQLEITRDAAANGSRPEQHLVIDAQDIAVLKPIPERRRPNREHD